MRPRPNGGRAGARGYHYYEKRISHENRILSDRIMGVETPIPPIMIMPPPPKGRPRGGSMTDISKKHGTAPPCPGGALRRGALISVIFMVWV